MLDKEFHCAQCDLTEQRCLCIKYCCLCGSTETTRLVGDGFYYCAICREACEYKTQDEANA